MVDEPAGLVSPADYPAPRTRAEFVAEQIRVQIARGQFVAGDPLPSETALLGEHGVARPTMREALRILESEGLLTVKRGKHGGPRIATPRVEAVARQAGFLLQLNSTSLADVFRARRVIETPAIDNLDALSDPEVLDTLDVNVAKAWGLIDDDAAIVSEGTSIHDEFHALIVRVGAGDTLSLFHTMIESIIGRSSQSFLVHQSAPRRRRSAYQLTVQAHADIADALRRRDADAAAELWFAHLSVVEQSMIRSAGGAQKVIDLFG